MASDRGLWDRSLAGYEKHVGSRTDVRMLPLHQFKGGTSGNARDGAHMHEFARHLLSDPPGTPLVIMMEGTNQGPEAMLRTPVYKKASELRAAYKNHSISIEPYHIWACPALRLGNAPFFKANCPAAVEQNPRFDGGSRQPTAGFRSLVLLRECLSFCKTHQLYGFRGSEWVDVPEAPYHYFEDQRSDTMVSRLGPSSSSQFHNVSAEHQCFRDMGVHHGREDDAIEMRSAAPTEFNQLEVPPSDRRLQAAVADEVFYRPSIRPILSKAREAWYAAGWRAQSKDRACAFDPPAVAGVESASEGAESAFEGYDSADADDDSGACSTLWYIYDLPLETSQCDLIANPENLGDNGNWAWERHIAPAIQTYGCVTRDGNKADAFYVPACTAATYMLLRKKEDAVEAGRMYEEALLAALRAAGPWWDLKRSKHFIHGTVCNDKRWTGAGFLPGGRKGDKFYPSLWDQEGGSDGGSGRALAICAEVSNSNAYPGKAPPHVLIPYYVPFENFRSPPSAEEYRRRPVSVTFHGSLCCGRKRWIPQALGEIEDARASTFSIKQRNDYSKDGGSAHAPGPAFFQETRFMLAPIGNVVHRGATQQAIAAGTLPLFSDAKSLTTAPFKACMPNGEWGFAFQIEKESAAADIKGALARLDRAGELEAALRALRGAQKVLNYHSSQWFACFLGYAEAALAAAAVDRGDGQPVTLSGVVQHAPVSSDAASAAAQHAPVTSSTARSANASAPAADPVAAALEVLERAKCPWNGTVAGLCCPLPKPRLRTCAVVSTAGYLGTLRLGAEIDAADAVIRVGAGPFEGYEEHVGSRTDLRYLMRYSLMGANHEERRQRIFVEALERDGAGVPLVVLHEGIHQGPESLQHAPDWPALAPVHANVAFYHLRSCPQTAALFVRHNRGLEQCSGTGGRGSGHFQKTLTTGLRVVLLLRSCHAMCERYKLYGFRGREWADDPTLPYHYFADFEEGQALQANLFLTPQQRKETGITHGQSHDFGAEHDCIELMGMKGSRESDVIEVTGALDPMLAELWNMSQRMASAAQEK